MAENSHSSTATHSIVEQESENEETEEILQTSTPKRTRNTSSVTLGDIHDENAYKKVESSSQNDTESSSVSRPNTPKARGPKKRSPIWQYFGCEGSKKDVQTFCLEMEEKCEFGTADANWDPI
ncbi:hypothetical protein DAPPUDRAFT_100169 [Daphnia pulex]|uniref:Uncharacterized protein n=1 Tax=Daphnia pulex TaxID=6669 RepID=E9G9L7_DAPPU|nr:hypothetical protein DAPPUDRAFT_100169 [Daphnia pulex]|eukprot:EFX83857.1 hypothetical protein DAPPUDRAFT_100169 [Daphnia pulex]